MYDGAIAYALWPDDLARPRRPLAHDISATWLEPADPLHVAARPADLHAHHARRLAQADLLAERRAAEAPAAAHRPVEDAHAGRCLDRHREARALALPVRADPLELQPEPRVPVPGVAIERAPRLVRQVRA